MSLLLRRGTCTVSFYGSSIKDVHTDGGEKLCQKWTNVDTRKGVYRVGQKSKLLILSEYVNKTEKIGGM